jgi:hypothetical protein
MSSAIDWSEIIKKEARGVNDDDLGEVQGFRDDDIITKVGMIGKETYCIPKNLVDRFDGHNVWFKISKDEANSLYKVSE